MNKKYFEFYADKYYDYLWEDAIDNAEKIIEKNKQTEASHNKFYESIRKITFRAYEQNDNRTVVYTQDGEKVFNSLISCIDDTLCGATTTCIPDFVFNERFTFDYQRKTPVCFTKFGGTTIVFYATPVIY